MLIAEDPEYLREEAQQIISEVYDSCSTSIRAPHAIRGMPSSGGALIDSDKDRASLGIPDQVTLLVEKTRYRRALAESHRILEG